MTAPDALTVRPRGPVRGRARLPGSKSLTNRALLLAALAEGETRLPGALESDDTRAMAEGLRALGYRVHASGPEWRVLGTGAPPRVAGEVAIDVRAAGTAMRFLTALAAAGEGTVRLDGSARMRQRPMRDLIAALRDLGVDADARSPGGCPPVVVRGRGLPGGRVRVPASVSSQFASALLMVSPLARAPLEVELAGEVISRPFIDMTLALMQRFGVDLERPGPDRYRPPPRRPLPRRPLPHRAGRHRRRLLLGCGRRRRRLRAHTAHQTQPAGRRRLRAGPRTHGRRP